MEWSNRGIIELLRRIIQTNVEIRDLLAQLVGQGSDTAVSARFAVIRHRSIATGELIPMTTMLLSDVISNIPVEFDNAGGTAVPAPTGTLSFSLDNAAMGTVATGADGVSCDFTPAQPADLTQTGNITGTDTAGANFNMTLAVGLTADEVATQGHFVTTGITTRPLGT